MEIVGDILEVGKLEEDQDQVVLLVEEVSGFIINNGLVFGSQEVIVVLEDELLEGVMEGLQVEVKEELLEGVKVR